MIALRAYRDDDAPALSALIRRNFLEVNIRDYPCDEMARLAQGYSADRVRGVAASGHMYVAENDQGLLTGTGCIAPFWGSQTESILLTIFVLPEYQGRGVGRLIVEALERDPYALRARRIEIPASITGAPFYEKMGYGYKDGKKALDEDRLYRMEKFFPEP